MSLLQAHQKLLESGRPRGAEPDIVAPSRALVDLVRFADDGHTLASIHPWELAPRVSRELEDRFGYTPPGGWARLTGLAAGAGIVHATPDRFVVLATADWIEGQPHRFCTRMVEAFTKRLIPPAAAAALYVALDVHPLWGLELGRDVGACQHPHGPSPGAKTALPVVRELVFGTLTGLVTSLRCVEADLRYPADVLGDVLWESAVSARRLR